MNNTLIFYACNCASLGYPNHLPLCPNSECDCGCPSSGHLAGCRNRNLPEPKLLPRCGLCGERFVDGNCNDPNCVSNLPLPPKPPALPKTVFKFLVQVEIEQDALHCSQYETAPSPILPHIPACVSCLSNQRSFLRAIISAQISNYLHGKDPLHWFPYKPSITVTPEL